MTGYENLELHAVLITFRKKRRRSESRRLHEAPFELWERRAMCR